MSEEIVALVAIVAAFIIAFFTLTKTGEAIDKRVAERIKKRE